MKPLIILLLSILPLYSFAQNTAEDKEKLARAVEYFNGEKYHEAGIIFRNLNKKYNLNTRFKAYLGICELKDWNYTAVTEIFDSIYTDLTVYAPLEQNVYYNAAAESHFNLGNYHAALKYYELALTVCANKEKADICFKAGICCLQFDDDDNPDSTPSNNQDNNPESVTKAKAAAKDYLTRSLNYYNEYPTGKDEHDRMKQISTMLRKL